MKKGTEIMSKNRVEKEDGPRLIIKCEPGYYMAVVDVTESRGKMGEEMVEQDTFRYFNEKFVESPEKALFLACDSYNRRWHDPATDIMENVVYDPKTQEFVRRTILTIDGHKPNPKQMEKIMNGTYEYILFVERIQVFQTVLIDDPNMVKKSIKVWKDYRNSFNR